MLSVLVPYRPDNGHRDHSWRWLEQRYAALLPEAELIVEADDGGADPGEFNHPRAINRAAHRARGDVFLIADADTAWQPAWIRYAHGAVAGGSAPWVLPSLYVKLTEAASAEILALDPETSIDALGPDDTEWLGESVSWAGLVVVPRHAFELVGGYDERYAKWGADDVAFGLTMDTLHGPHVRLAGAALHLWHPAPLEQTYGHDRHQAQHQLGERYVAAAGNVDAMRSVRFG